MTAPTDLRPIRAFDPSRPAMLYDELNDELFEWKPFKLNNIIEGASTRTINWRQSWDRWATVHDLERDVMEWDGLLIAGWKPLLG